jgi:hypothetical protein
MSAAAEGFLHLLLPSSDRFREDFGMRVEIKAAVKKKQQSSIGLLMLLAVPFVVFYFLASPAITAHMPSAIERALTNYRGEVDKAIDSVGTMLSGAYYQVAGR